MQNKKRGKKEDCFSDCHSGEGLWLQSRPITVVVVCVDLALATGSDDQVNSAEHQLLCNMRGLLLLLNALLLLESTDGTYDQLSQYEKYIIDKAIDEANERYGRNKHIDFDSILSSVSYLIQMLNHYHFTVICLIVFCAYALKCLIINI